MLAKETLHKEIDTLPDEYAGELLDFVNYLKRKLIKEQMEVTILSESLCKKIGCILKRMRHGKICKRRCCCRPLPFLRFDPGQKKTCACSCRVIGMMQFY